MTGKGGVVPHPKAKASDIESFIPWATRGNWKEKLPRRGFGVGKKEPGENAYHAIGELLCPRRTKNWGTMGIFSTGAENQESKRGRDRLLKKRNRDSRCKMHTTSNASGEWGSTDKGGKSA